MVFALGGLGSWQLYLIATNQTNIEYYINEDKEIEAKEEGRVASLSRLSVPIPLTNRRP